MAAQVLPKELRLTAPPTMPRARSYMFKQQATATTTPAGGTITINLPRLQRSYLTKDSYLKFAVSFSMKSDTNAGEGAAIGKYVACWDTIGALGLIDKIEIYDYLGSTLLESTSGHGQLLTLLNDISVGPTDMSTFHGLTQGTYSNRLTGSVYTNLTTIAQDTTPNSLTPTSGAPIIDAAHASTVTITKEYCVPLFSFLGLLSTKYAPLHNGYTINITLNPINVALGVCETKVSGGAFTFSASDYTSFTDPTGLDLQVRDVNMCCQVLELGAEAEGLLQSSTGGAPFIVPTKAFRNYVGVVPANSTSYRLDLNLNVASLTNILWMMRPSDFNKIYHRSLSERYRNFLQSWYFQYGSSILPQTSGIQCRSRNTTPQYGNEFTGDEFDCTEAYIELLKARHAFNQPVHLSQIDAGEFVIDKKYDHRILAVRNTNRTGKFAAGLDLELVSGRSNDMVCGMNTNGMNTSIYATFDPTKAVSVTEGGASVPQIKECRVDAWCEYDAFINVLPGVATTVSF